MGPLDAIFTGISGLQASQESFNVIANNIANLNTTGYKGSQINFADTLAQTMNSGTIDQNPIQVGTGVGVGSITTDMTQGTSQQTGNPLDLSIVGNGFLVVSNGANQSYTRDGALQLNSANKLVMSDTGLSVLGWQVNAATGKINTSAPPTTLTIPQGQNFAQATSNAVLNGNINAAGKSTTVAFTAYDSLGAAHQITVTFAAPSNGTVNWTATSPDASGTLGSGTLTFDSSGNLTTGGSGAITMNLTKPNGAMNPDNFNIDFSGISCLDSSSSSVQLASQDGLQSGTLDNYSIDGNGVITGMYSNGGSQVLGQVALATFSNPMGLKSSGSNLLTTSPSSGTAQIGQANASGTQIASGALEASNVDLTDQFANMIVAQTDYGANSQTITTSNKMLQETMQLMQ